MGMHKNSDHEKRKRKYAEQFAKTAENKRRKAEKRQRQIKKRREKKESK